jgi:hypothetical protein
MSKRSHKRRQTIVIVFGMVTRQLQIGLLETSVVKSLLISRLNKDLQNSKVTQEVG